MTQRTYAVTGMTCGHCAQSVTAGVKAVAGVSEVKVELDTGELTVAGEDFEDHAVRQAVDEAGYQVAD